MKRLAIVSALVKKDLLRRWRAPLGTLLMLSFPLVFAGLMALTFGPRASNVPKVRLLIEDLDKGLVSQLIRSAFTSAEASKYFVTEVVETGGFARLEAGEASALLRLPKGLSDDLLDGQPVVLELVKNPAETILPEVAQQITLVLAEVLGAGVRLLEGPLQTLRPYLDDENDSSMPDVVVAALAIESAHLVSHAERFLLPPAIELEAVKLGEKPESKDTSGAAGAIFLFILPGVGVFALFSLVDQQMRDLLTEGRLGTLRRLLTGPIDTRTLILGKAFAAAVIASGSLVLLSVIGWFVGGLSTAISGFDLVGFLCLSATLIVAATGTAALVYGASRTERQGGTIGSLLYLTMGFSGGSFIPFDSLPRSMKAIAPFSPFYWATDGYHRLLDGASLAAVAKNTVVLAVLGVVLLAAGAWLLARRVERGASA